MSIYRLRSILKTTLRLVARYADACNLQPGPQIPQKLEVLQKHCEAEGREYDAIEKTCAFAFRAILGHADRRLTCSPVPRAQPARRQEPTM
jgi:hypothetical protein